MNIPNLLTVLRIILTPVFVIFLLKGWTSMALMVFAVASISDGLDGLIARYFDQRTELGAYLDPIADKLLLVSAFIGLAFLNSIPSWLTIIVISRDVVIVLGIVVFSLVGKEYEVSPTQLSKLNTVIQLVTILFVLLYPALDSAYAFKQFLYWLTALLTVLSGLHYIYLGLFIVQDEPKA